MTTNTYHIKGLTCGHCAAAVTEELSALEGVSDVSVALVAGAISTVTLSSLRPLNNDQIGAALEEAGNYRLVTAAG